MGKRKKLPVLADELALPLCDTDVKAAVSKVKRQPLEAKYLALQYASIGDTKRLRKVLENSNKYRYRLVNDADSVHKMTPLMWSISFGHEQCVKLLLSYASTKLDCQDKDGRTAVHIGVEYNHPCRATRKLTCNNQGLIFFIFFYRLPN